jgi:hypothetical protein
MAVESICHKNISKYHPKYGEKQAPTHKMPSKRFVKVPKSKNNNNIKI